MAAEKPDIHAIFDEALTRDLPEERARYLDEACGDDPKVRERVEALLRAHAASRKSGGPSLSKHSAAIDCVACAP